MDDEVHEDETPIVEKNHRTRKRDHEEGLNLANHPIVPKVLERHSLHEEEDRTRHHPIEKGEEHDGHDEVLLGRKEDTQSLKDDHLEKDDDEGRLHTHENPPRPHNEGVVPLSLPDTRNDPTKKGDDHEHAHVPQDEDENENEHEKTLLDPLDEKRKAKKTRKKHNASFSISPQPLPLLIDILDHTERDLPEIPPKTRKERAQKALSIEQTNWPWVGWDLMLGRGQKSLVRGAYDLLHERQKNEGEGVHAAKARKRTKANGMDHPSSLDGHEEEGELESPHERMKKEEGE